MRRLAWIIASAAALATVSYASAAAAPRVASCKISGAGHVQICPVAFKAIAGTAAHVVVARYGDFSNCNLPAPSSEPGENFNYVVSSVTINWGDGTRPTKGVAKTGTRCPPADPYPDGQVEPIYGTHRYKKRGTYTVSVSLTYVRGSGNTFANCATSTPGSTVYSNLTNCIALKAPASSIGVIKKKR